MAKRAGVERIVIDGSFVTDIAEPNDVDCVLLIGPGFPHDPGAETELIEGLPFLDINLVGEAGWDKRVGTVFAIDRYYNPKGLIEVMTWSYKDEREVEVTREKLYALEVTYRELSEDAGQDAHVDALTQRSLKRLINQMKDEIARFEARRSSPAAKSAVGVIRT